MKEDIPKEKQSLAMEFVSTLKEHNKRMFLCWLITFIALTSLVVYTIYLLNDIAVIETTEITQESDTGHNNYIGNDGEIIDTFDPSDRLMYCAWSVDMV